MWLQYTWQLTIWESCFNAEVYKLEMGVAIKGLGIHVFVAFAIVVIPTDKRLDGAHRLELVLMGQSTYEGYKRIVGRESRPNAGLN